MNKKDSTILLAHGSGGKMMDNLIRDFYAKFNENGTTFQLSDSYVFPSRDGHLAFTTDSYIIDPIFFPGGDIGMLAVCGTINDLAVSGAKPIYLTCSFIIEEGFSLEELEKIVQSMADTAQKAGVKIVTGDTKVVPRGKADKIFVNTSGIGVVKTRDRYIASGKEIKVGDLILVNGSLGEHAIAVLTARNKIQLENPVLSDTQSLNTLTHELLNQPGAIKFMRDATRGGLASVLVEVVENREFGILLNENNVLINREVQGVCDLFGFDPLYLANEGKLVAIVDRKMGEKVLEIMKSHPLGKDAAIIGEVTTEKAGQVILQTKYGGSRMITKLMGEQLPRIC